MPHYQTLSRDELLRLSLEKSQLTDEARSSLDAELARRRLSEDDIVTFKAEETAATQARGKEVHEVSFSFVEKKLRGRTNYTHDPRFRIEEFEATLWVVLFWVPVLPLASYRIRREFRHWWICASDRYRVLERLPRNWEQILVTWIKTVGDFC
jgi:hypothetical protein